MKQLATCTESLVTMTYTSKLDYLEKSTSLHLHYIHTSMEEKNHVCT